MRKQAAGLLPFPSENVVLYQMLPLRFLDITDEERETLPLSYRPPVPSLSVAGGGSL